MRKTILIVLVCIVYASSFAQISYEEIESERLNSVRKLKIKLPKNYDPESIIDYPLVVVFDGDYLFEPVVGQVDFQSYFDEMPEAIVVGIVHDKDRFYDGYYDELTGLPRESGFRFHEFVLDELLPYIDNKYNTSSFRVAVGHDLMGNFINSYAFKLEPAFNAYIAISPDLMGSMQDYLAKRLEGLEEEVFYYMATAEKDIPEIRESILIADGHLKEVENQKVSYYFDDFKGETHYSLVTSAVARGFDKVFEFYNPLKNQELQGKVFNYEGTLDKYLVNRQERVERLFGIEKEISEEEFEKVAKIAEQREDLKSLSKLGQLANKLYPESLLGTYYLAQYSEKKGKTKKAKKLYESALALEDAKLIDKDFIFSKLDELALAEVDEDEEELEEGEEGSDEEN